LPDTALGISTPKEEITPLNKKAPTKYFKSRKKYFKVWGLLLKLKTNPVATPLSQDGASSSGVLPNTLKINYLE
jgi:hypothetical protein